MILGFFDVFFVYIIDFGEWWVVLVVWLVFLWYGDLVEYFGCLLFIGVVRID